MTGHLSDAALLLDATGEQPSNHVRHCELCQQRQAQLTDGVRAAEQAWRGEIVKQRPLGRRISIFVAGLTATVALFVAAIFWQARPPKLFDQPDPRLTPGRIQTQQLNLTRVCLASEEQHVPLSDARAMEVFRRYAIAKPKPGQFEIDYLIPPDLGGSPHPDNLWPQPYHAGVWNSHVKDALEDHLHNLVCSGQLDLATAQQDLKTGWITAYQKYFRTQDPLQEHAMFLKDRPWE
ncbi:hypothetical protein F183_A43100 [Bryobacterales bacterium F-183]|nr:hypothetical protein F183_A43100 [Bryobacterales bacterium F-183]